MFPHSPWLRLIAPLALTWLFVVPVASHSGTVAPPPESLRVHAFSEDITAPAFSLKGIDGHPLRLEDLKGKVVFLNFWATWCVPCREEMPAMERLYREYGERGLVVLAVNFQESPDTVKRFMRELHLTFPTVLDSDGAAARDFAVRGLPVSFLLSRDGRILWQAIGSREWDGAEARDYFKRILLPLRP